MDVVVPECRRVLKPTGSAVFILQPTCERVGRMRTWLWKFLARWGDEWNIVQDAWWWNTTAIPEAHAVRGRLLRPSLKMCVWLGSPDCFRDQDAVLWAESGESAAIRASGRLANRTSPGGHHRDTATIHAAAVRRGGVTPYNLLPISNGESYRSAGAHGHGAGTPRQLVEWWLRYLTRRGETVLDPFAGSGTTLLSALRLGRRAVGIERDAGFVSTIRRRLDEARGRVGLFAGLSW